MSTTENRVEFSSKLGFILSAAGSAVGLGNIWKFPGKAYACGGGAFLIIYLLIVAVVGTSVMMAEFTIGRKTHTGAVGALRELNEKFAWIGGLGVLTGFIIVCYYCQVGGWAMYYIMAYITDVQTVWADPMAYFLNMLGANGLPVGALVWGFIFMLLTAFIITCNANTIFLFPFRSPYSSKLGFGSIPFFSNAPLTLWRSFLISLTLCVRVSSVSLMILSTYALAVLQISSDHFSAFSIVSLA